MDFPVGITERALIDHLFARVEQLEGALRVYRALLPSIAAAMTPEQQEIASERTQLLIADAITSLDLQQGQTLHAFPKHRANQLTGFRGEWRQVATLLQEHVPGTSK